MAIRSKLLNRAKNKSKSCPYHIHVITLDLPFAEVFYLTIDLQPKFSSP